MKTHRIPAKRRKMYRELQALIKKMENVPRPYTCRNCGPSIKPVCGRCKKCHLCCNCDGSEDAGT